jgi:exopolysaccharide production protein ExoY
MRYAARLVDSSVRLRSNDRQPPVGGLRKRGFDVFSAAVAILLLSPLFGMLALLVKMSDGGSVFYAHRRVGRNGNVFHCLKFRTMVENGDEVLAAYFAENPDKRDEWLRTRKLQTDPRVTRIGQVLRKLSLDELPQVFNILIGHMSVVGPRPVVKDELELYGPAADCYLRTRPGLTGLWQVSGRNDVSYRTRIAFDQHYVENWSFFADIKIIVLTVPAILAARGSY